MRLTLFTICVLLSTLSFGQNIPDSLVVNLKPIASSNINFNEPSDLCLSIDGAHLLIPGDKAFLYECSLDGKKNRTLNCDDFDLEAICHDGKNYFVVEETYQRIYEYSLSLDKVVRTVSFHHHGGRNEGVESIAFDPASSHFYLSTEKNPQIFYETDKDFKVLNEFQIPGISEVSAMTFYQNKFYVLSDEAASVFCIRISDMAIEKVYKLPVINPEGIAFNSAGNMLISSDDMARLFTFKLEAK